MIKRTLAVMAFVAATGCPGDPIVDPDGTGTETGTETGTDQYTGPTTVATYTYECDPTSGEWYYFVETEGWTSGGTLDIGQETASPWSESHTLKSYEYDPNGYWDRLERRLPFESNFNNLAADTNTFFQCNEDRLSTMKFKAAVFDPNGNFADCIVWGNNAASMNNGDPCVDASDW